MEYPEARIIPGTHHINPIRSPLRGTTTRWMIEGGSPNTLFRRGITRESLPEGTLIKVDGYQAKDGSNRANGRDITLPDGKKIFVSGSAPNEQPGK